MALWKIKQSHANAVQMQLSVTGALENRPVVIYLLCDYSMLLSGPNNTSVLL